MTMKDMHNNIAIASQSQPGVAIGTTGTGQTIGPVDLAGYNGVEFLIGYGAVTSTTAVFTALMTEGETTNGSFTSVADADLLGTEAAAGLGAATRTNGTGDVLFRKIGYKGEKRYTKLKVSSTATAGTLISVAALLHSPRHAPTS